MAFDREFTCPECERHIIAIVSSGYEPLCSLCVSIPGWFANPRLRQVLDPSHDGHDPADSRRTVFGERK